MSRKANLHTHEIVVSENEAHVRLDKLISQQLEQYTRSFILRLIKTDCILVNQQIKKPGYIVRTGDLISITILDCEPQTALPEPIPLEILYEDDELLIINKQSGLVVHPAPGHANGTLVNALLHYNSRQFSKVNRFGIVHRLDQDTTGCLLVAKNRFSQAYLNDAFKERTIEKKYCAIVNGRMNKNQGIINYPIGRHPTNRKKMSINARQHRSAETHWNVSCQFEHFTLLDVLLKTGRTHQIRVHFSAINHPIVGDPLYGKNRNWHYLKTNLQAHLKQINRQMLHAMQLGFVHPTTKQFMRIIAPLPEDMRQILDVLQKC
jgi:23S rRNA pseudouridine1911/1915/1917 synthase